MGLPHKRTTKTKTCRNYWATLGEMGAGGGGGGGRLAEGGGGGEEKQRCKQFTIQYFV